VVDPRAVEPEPGVGTEAIWDGWSQSQKFLDDGTEA